MNLKIEDATGLVFWIGSNDMVQVPMRLSERVLCRQVLVDALTLLDQTEVKKSTFSTADGQDRCSQQNELCLRGFREVYGCAHQATPQAGTRKDGLRLVSVDRQQPDC
jgi:hypothetical protein